MAFAITNVVRTSSKTATVISTPVSVDVSYTGATTSVDWYVDGVFWLTTASGAGTASITLTGYTLADLNTITYNLSGIMVVQGARIQARAHGGSVPIDSDIFVVVSAITPFIIASPDAIKGATFEMHYSTPSAEIGGTTPADFYAAGNGGARTYATSFFTGAALIIANGYNAIAWAFSDGGTSGLVTVTHSLPSPPYGIHYARVTCTFPIDEAASGYPTASPGSTTDLANERSWATFAPATGWYVGVVAISS